MAAGERRRRAMIGLVAALAGLVVLVACGLAVRNGTVGSAERRVFHAINDLPEWLYRPMWVFQQFGNLVVAFVIVLVIALLLRRPQLAGAAVLGVVAKLALERVVKSFVERSRPGTSIGDVVLRGNVSRHGFSFVSGHAVITTAFATVLMAVLPRRWKPVPWAVVVLNGLARVYVGAHNPLDIVGGAGLGLFIGGLLYAGMVALSRDVEGSRSPAP
jgi:undecaprenyl-diphosphatase